MSDYERPRTRNGLVCWYAQWDRDGKLRETRYRKPGRTEQPAGSGADGDNTLARASQPLPGGHRTRRGAVAAELKARQGTLEL